jgi:4a-hydroxytetrahydrobiopterin dehydratase
MDEKLQREQILEELKQYDGWVYDGSSIVKTFKTKSYPATMGFVTAIGSFCQRRNHHPDYILVKFKEIEVSFSTHSAEGVTSKDIEIAKDLETLPL